MSHIVVGSSLASLVLLDKLKGHRNIVWYVNQKQINNFLTGFTFKNQINDLGMIVFNLDEQHSKWSPSKDLNYDQFDVNPCRNFFKDISNYLETWLELVETPKIKILSENGIFEDFMLSNNLQNLGNFLGMHEQKNKNLPPGDLHPKNKYDDRFREKFIDTPLKSYVENIYGEYIYRRIYKPWLNKLSNSKIENSPTIMHRSFLAPLYYPETLDSELNSKTKISPTRFSYPSLNSVSQWYTELLKSCLQNTNFEIRNLEKISLEELNNNKNRIYWGDNLKNFLRITDNPEFHLNIVKSKIDLITWEADDSNLFDFALINLTESDDSWFRISKNLNFKSKIGRVLITLERKSMTKEVSYNELFDRLKIKKAIKVFSTSRVPHFKVMGKDDYKNLTNKYMRLNNNYKNIKFIMHAAYPFSMTISDQIIQGLFAFENL
jgi:hypothetical protein